MTPNPRTSPNFVGCSSVQPSLVPAAPLSKPIDWKCIASQKSQRTVNPIRAIVDPILRVKSLHPTKARISLALGDPTVSSSLKPCPLIQEALESGLDQTAGYISSTGTLEARTAIAEYDSSSTTQRVSEDDVIVANGCSGALELVLTALLDEDSILLVPKPGFPLYQVIAESHGASINQYQLDPTKRWECDLVDMERLLRSHPPGKIRGIVVNNPSNPTGSVYSKEHLQGLVDLAYRYRVPLVADEVYGNLVQGDAMFYSLGHVAAGRVPVICTSGLAKQFLLPGWRVGWAVFYDSDTGALRPILEGAKSLSQVILGASHLTQSVIPALLTPKLPEQVQQMAEWKRELKQNLEYQARLLCGELSKAHGLLVYTPQGAMYAMVKIDFSKFSSTIKSDVAFTKLLLEEENVFVLPGQAFSMDGVFRVVYCASCDQLQEAADRIRDFCQRHAIH